MDTRLKWALGVVGVLAVAGVAYWLFAPEGSTHVSEATPGGEAVKRGTLMDGAPGHHASGTVALLRVDERYVLRLEGYEATPGPDVFFYLTPAQGASTTEAVEGEGLRVDTPARGGQATLRGDFNLALPEGFDPSRYAGLAVWCEQYNVLFGHAALADA